MVQPGGVFVVLGEEGALHPVVVAALNETQGEHFLAVDLGDALEAAIGGAFKAGQAMALILSQRFLGAKPFGGGVN